MTTKTATVTRAALGRTAKIGALYDIRTDSFLNDTLFASELDGGMIDIVDLGETAIELVTSDSLEEKCHVLDVEAGLKVSLMAGMLQLNGSGSYLAEERKSSRAQSMSLIFTLRTVNEEVMVRQNTNKIDLDVLSGRTTDATHVVVAIDWGAICSITCEYENFENKDCTEVKGSLKAEIEMIKGLIDVQGSAKVTYEDGGNKQHNKFTFKCKADVSAPDSDLPLTFELAMELARNLPSLVKKTNGGKGVPLTYHLMPLEAVNKLCKSRKTLDVLYKEINAGTVKKCADVLARVTQKRQKLYDIHHDMFANGAFVPDKSVEAIDEIFEEETVRESRFRAELQQLIISVRSGSAEVCDLEKFLGEHEPEKNLSEHRAAISGFQKDLDDVSMIKSWRAKGIRYLGKKDVLQLDEKPHVVVFYKMTRSNDTSNLDKNQDFFLRLQATHAAEDDYEFIIVDRELSEQYWPSGVTKPVIRKYHKGLLVCRDLYVKEGRDMEMCLIELARPVYCRFRTKNRAYACLRCPNAVAGNGLCTSDPVNWRCSKCKDLVEYGIDKKKFYCRCGESVPVESRFRCNDQNHSMMFVSYPSDILNAELSQHSATKEFNILILGETGVGKSIWINGFHNYLYFDDLYEAKNSPELHVLIPSSFTFTKAGEVKVIQIGEQDINEVMETWTSTTKEPRSYVFYVGGARIRLIDTPGIGACEGIEQDRKNVDNILSYLTFYDEIHAVCILLKPNHSRLTAMFRFCIQELLVQLHSSAKDNIVFCFTNARATFYQPGDTLPVLNKELRVRKVGIQATPHNYFCFDNEPFRFLACVKNGVKFSQADIDTYAKSWDKSVEETKRLLKYITAELKPHKVRDTLSMNEARRIIVAMSKPLAEVARTIDQNVQSAQSAKEQIELDDSDIRSLEKNLKFAGYDIERVELGYPRVVCTAPSCVEFVQVGTDKVPNTVYKQICQHHCHLKGIPTQTTNNPALRSCAFVGPDGYCHKCRHHYTLHMHLTYDHKIIYKEFLSESVKKEIQKKSSAKTQKEAAKRVIDTKITELQEEEKHIVRTSTKYGSFLKANALIPYNDAVGDYLDMCIAQEKMKSTEFRNTALLSKMQEMKDEYERQRAILDEAIDTGVGENIRTPEQVKELQRELFQLKHFGPKFKRLFDRISITNSARNISFEENIVPVPPKYTDKSNTDNISWRKCSKTGTLTDRHNNRPGHSDRYSELKEELQRKNKRIKSLTERLRQGEQSGRQQIEQLQSKIENQRRLRDGKRALLADLRDTKAKLTSEEQRIQVLTESLMEKEQSEAAARQLLDEKEKVMARYEFEVQETKNKLTSEKQRVQVLTESLMEKEQSEAAARQLLDEKEKVMARYEVEVQETKNKLTSEKQRIQVLTESLIEKEQSEAAARQLLDEKEKAMARYEVEVQEKKNKLTSEKQRIRVLTESIMEKEQSEAAALQLLDEKEKAMARYEVEVQEKKNKLTSKEQRIQVLTESLMEKEQSSEKAALQLLEEKKKVMSRTTESLKNEFMELERENWKLRTKIQEESKIRSEEHKENAARKHHPLTRITYLLTVGKHTNKGIQGATSLDTSDESLEGIPLLSNTSDPSQVSVARDGFDDILKKVAQNVVNNNEIDDLGKALGFTPEDICRYTAENSMYHCISYMGTLRMLRDWCKTQTNSGKSSALHQALKHAKFIRLADEIFGKGKTGTPGEPSESDSALPHSTSSTSADEKTSTSKVRSEASTDDVAKVLKQLADDLGDDDDQIRSLGGQLGILQHDIKQAIQANKRSSKVPNIGTLGLLKTWREDVSCESEGRELRRALISANMVNLARKYLDEGGPNNVKEDTPSPSFNAKDHISGDTTPQGEECTDGLTHQSGKATTIVDLVDDKPEGDQLNEGSCQQFEQRSDKDPDDITVTSETAENGKTNSYNSCCRCQ